MIYFVVFFLLLLLPRDKKWAGILFFCILWLLSACRYNIGYDYPNYEMIIESTSDDNSFTRLEWTSQLLMELARYFNFTQLYFIITSFLIMAPVAYVFSKESEDYSLSALLFYSLPVFFLGSLSCIRQGVACSFIILMIYFLGKRRNIAALISWLIACQFHISAYICAAMFLIYINVWSLKLCITAWCSSLALGILARPLLSQLISIIPAGNNPILLKLQNFVLNPNYLALRGYKGTQILFNLIFFCMIFFYKKLENFEPKYKNYFHIMVMGIVVLNLGSPFGVTGGRLSIYFFSTLFFLLPIILRCCGQFSRILRVLLIIFCLFLLAYTILYFSYYLHLKGVIDRDSYLPYKTFFAK